MPNAEFRQRLREAGICTQCGKNPSRNGRGSPCVTCAEYHKARFRRLVADGMCPAHVKSRAEPGATRCSVCIEKSRQKTKTRSASRKAAGLCVNCGKESAKRGKVSCAGCAASMAAAKRLRSTGVSPEQYAAALERQAGKCAICRQTETKKLYGKVIALAADHDHGTGEFRGLLCYRCNASIGQFEDSPALLMTAAT